MQSNPMPGKRWVSIAILKAASVALLLLFVLWGRVFYGSMQDYKTGETLLKENQIIRAVTYFDRSLHWYAPLNPYVQKSAQRLWEIGDRAERDGDLKLAFIAFNTIRSGFYGSSHFVVPGKQWIDRSESRIRDLIQIEKKTKLLPDQKVNPPDVFWTVVLEIGLLGWIGSVLGLILAGIGRPKESKPPSALIMGGLALAAISFALWILGMFKA
jgi:hypothetical protein